MREWGKDVEKKTKTVNCLPLPFTKSSQINSAWNYAVNLISIKSKKKKFEKKLSEKRTRFSIFVKQIVILINLIEHMSVGRSVCLYLCFQSLNVSVSGCFWCWCIFFFLFFCNNVMKRLINYKHSIIGRNARVVAFRRGKHPMLITV